LNGTTGRNRPCPCGSGKKYKNCCGMKNAGDSREAARQKWRRIDEELNKKLLLFSQKESRQNDVIEAWEKFTVGKHLFDPESPHLQAFFPWYFHEYTPSGRGSGEIPATLAMRYWTRWQERAGEDEKDYILANRNVPYAFWEAVECDPGRGFSLKNVLSGETADVTESLGSRNVQQGDILFCRVIRLKEIAVLNGCGSFAIPPRYLPMMIRFRSELRKSGGDEKDPRTARTVEPAVLQAYWEIMETLFSTPVLNNTDGEPIEMHEMEFRIDSADEAFERLKPLCASESAEELLRSVERDTDGGIRTIEFNWTKKGNSMQKSWESTLLGTLRINGNTLTVSVNSRKRADKIRREIESRLRGRARYLGDHVRSMEALLAERGRGEPPGPKADPEQKELFEHPEVREMMRSQLDEHWKNWIHMNLDGLGGLTPVQAAETEEGREMLEAMFRQMERDDARQDPWMSQKAYIERAKKKLGLA